MEACYAPGQSWATALSHYHPVQDERFDVLEGMLTVEIDGIKRIRACVRPALQTQELLEKALELADNGGFAGPAQFGALLQAYEQGFCLEAPGR